MPYFSILYTLKAHSDHGSAFQVDETLHWYHEVVHYLVWTTCFGNPAHFELLEWTDFSTLVDEWIADEFESTGDQTRQLVLHFPIWFPLCCAISDQRLGSSIKNLPFLGSALPNMPSQTLPDLSIFWIKRLIVDRFGLVALSLNSVANFLWVTTGLLLFEL